MRFATIRVVFAATKKIFSPAHHARATAAESTGIMATHPKRSPSMNDIANGIQDVIANFSSLIDMLSAVAGGVSDVAAAMNAVLHVIAMLTGA
jgi:hypothetical protein